MARAERGFQLSGHLLLSQYEAPTSQLGSGTDTRHLCSCSKIKERGGFPASASAARERGEQNQIPDTRGPSSQASHPCFYQAAFLWTICLLYSFGWTNGNEALSGNRPFACDSFQRHNTRGYHERGRRPPC